MYKSIEDERPLYGNATSNFVESECARADTNGARYMTPCEAMDRMLMQVVEIVGNGVDMLVKSAGFLCPNAAEHYAAVSQRVAYYVVAKNGLISYVTHRTQTTERRAVDLENKTCTCGEWGQTKMPCVHVVAAVMYDGTLSEDPLKFFTDFFSPIYHHKAALNALLDAVVVVPVPVEVETAAEAAAVDDHILPPAHKKGRGRPRKTRFRGAADRGGGGGGRVSTVDASIGVPATQVEMDMDAAARALAVASGADPTVGVSTTRTRGPYRCSVCQSTTHNAKTCDKKRKDGDSDD